MHFVCSFRDLISFLQLNLLHFTKLEHPCHYHNLSPETGHSLEPILTYSSPPKNIGIMWKPSPLIRKKKDIALHIESVC